MKNLLVDSNIFCIFIFILIVSANFLAEIFPCRLQNVLLNNMFIKHVFGLFTMIFFVVLSSDLKNKNIFNVVNNSVFLYILFILISKCHVYAFYVVLLLLGLTYIIHIVKREEIEKQESYVNDSKKESNENDSKKESNENDSKKEIPSTTYDTMIYVLYILIIIFTILGVLLYLGEKKIEYNTKFDYFTFFIGKPLCSWKDTNVTFIEAFKNAFAPIHPRASSSRGRNMLSK